MPDGKGVDSLIESLASSKAEKADPKKISELKEKLLGQITASSLSPEVQENLTRNLTESSEIFEKSSIWRLDNYSKAPLSDGSKGLRALQEKSIKHFNDQKKTLADEKQKAEIAGFIIQLQALHQQQQTLLTKALAEESNSRTQDAYAAFRGHTHMPALSEAAPPGELSKKDFLSDLKTTYKNSFTDPTDPTGRRSIQLTGDSLSSPDPETLGKALAAAGHKTVEISSGSAREALDTARWALASGVQAIEFDENTRRLITSPSSYPKSFGQYLDAQKEYEAISNISRANQSVKLGDKTTISEVLNMESKDLPVKKDLKLDHKAQVVRELGTTRPGLKTYLELMTEAEKAQLAAKLDEQDPDKIYYRGNKAYANAHDFIASFDNNKEERTTYEDEYAKAWVEFNIDKIVDAKTPEEKAKLITSQDNEYVRHHYYGNLSRLTKEGEESHKLSACLMSNVLDRSLKKLMQPTFLKMFRNNDKIFNANMNELADILEKAAPEDRQAIQAFFEEKCAEKRKKLGDDPVQMKQFERLVADAKKVLQGNYKPKPGEAGLEIGNYKPGENLSLEEGKEKPEDGLPDAPAPRS